MGQAMTGANVKLSVVNMMARLWIDLGRAQDLFGTYFSNIKTLDRLKTESTVDDMDVDVEHPCYTSACAQQEIVQSTTPLPR